MIFLLNQGKLEASYCWFLTNWPLWTIYMRNVRQSIKIILTVNEYKCRFACFQHLTPIISNQSFQRKTPVIRIVKMAGGRVAGRPAGCQKGIPIVRITLPIVFIIWILMRKYQLLNFVIFSQLIAYTCRVPFLYG